MLLGLGVKVDGVQQVIDKFLEERVRGAASDVASSEAQADAYSKLESAINELGDNDLSTSLTDLFRQLARRAQSAGEHGRSQRRRAEGASPDAMRFAGSTARFAASTTP